MRIVTPGTVVEDTLLDEESNNYIVSVCSMDNEIGMAFADVSTGEFYLCSENTDDKYSVIFNELTRLNSSEVLVNGEMKSYIDQSNDYKKISGISYSENVSDYFQFDFAKALIVKHFGSSNVDVNKYEKSAVCAAGCLLRYISVTQLNSLEHINRIHVYDFKQYMSIDTFTRKSLEVNKTIIKNKKKGSLLWVIDKTATSLGSRKSDSGWKCLC